MFFKTQNYLYDHHQELQLSEIFSLASYSFYWRTWSFTYPINLSQMQTISIQKIISFSCGSCESGSSTCLISPTIQNEFTKKKTKKHTWNLHRPIQSNPSMQQICIYIWNKNKRITWGKVWLKIGWKLQIIDECSPSSHSSFNPGAPSANITRSITYQLLTVCLGNPFPEIKVWAQIYMRQIHALYVSSQDGFGALWQFPTEEYEGKWIQSRGRNEEVWDLTMRTFQRIKWTIECIWRKKEMKV